MLLWETKAGCRRAECRWAACGRPAWGHLSLGQLSLTLFSSLRVLVDPRSLAMHSASLQLSLGPEACWPCLDRKTQDPVEKRPEGSAQLPGHWIWPELGRLVPAGLWGEALTPHMCIPWASCSHSVDPWAYRDTPGPLGRLMMDGSPCSTQRCLGVCGGYLLSSASSCRLL